MLLVIEKVVLCCFFQAKGKKHLYMEVGLWFKNSSQESGRDSPFCLRASWEYNTAGLQILLKVNNF